MHADALASYPQLDAAHKLYVTPPNLTQTAGLHQGD